MVQVEVVVQLGVILGIIILGVGFAVGNFWAKKKVQEKENVALKKIGKTGYFTEELRLMLKVLMAYPPKAREDLAYDIMSVLTKHLDYREKHALFGRDFFDGAEKRSLEYKNSDPLKTNMMDFAISIGDMVFSEEFAISSNKETAIEGDL